MKRNALSSVVLVLLSLAACHGETDVGARRGALVVARASARSFAVVAAAPSTTPTVATAPVATPVAAATAPRSPVPPAAAGKLKVKRLVVARGVEKREPVGAGASFSAEDARRLYGFVELENPARTENDVVLSFERDDSKDARGNVKLAVGAAPRWRTWGFSRAVKEAGTWSVVVRDATGTELARERFEVTL